MLVACQGISVKASDVFFLGRGSTEKSSLPRLIGDMRQADRPNRIQIAPSVDDDRQVRRRKGAQTAHFSVTNTSEKDSFYVPCSTIGQTIYTSSVWEPMNL